VGYNEDVRLRCKVHRVKVNEDNLIESRWDK